MKCENDITEPTLPTLLKVKAAGNLHLIPYLKGLNNYLEYKHFKMKTLHQVLSLMQPYCYLETTDLKQDHQSFLRTAFWKLGG